MTYDRKTIEENGVDLVKKQLRTLNVLDPNIPTNDKGVSWDGYVLVYQTVPFAKNKLRAKIPTQVKTRTFNRFKDKFNIPIADLKNYRKDGSILYFLVENVRGKSKIFYVPLFLIDLERLINTYSNATNAPVKFLPFPEEVTAIRNVIEDYIKIANKQKQILPNVYDFDTFRNQYPNRPLSFELHLPMNPTARDIVNSIIRQKPYVYYQYDNGLSVPVGKMEYEKFSLMIEDNIEIRVNDEILYSKIRQENFSDKLRLRIGSTIILDLKGNTFEVNYSIKNANLSEAIKTLQFMIALITNEPIYFNNLRIFRGVSINKGIDVNALRKQLDMFLDIQILFNRLGIRKSLVPRSLSDTELNNLIMLCQSELYNQEVPLDCKNSNFGYVNIGDIHILCYCQQAARQGYYIIKSIFNKDLSISFALPDENGSPIPVGRYLLLLQDGVNSFKLIDNINYDDLIESLNVDKIPPQIEEAYNTLLLNMLTYYDEVNYEKILVACEWLSNYLWTNYGKDIYFINLCQVKYRVKTLTDNEKSDIVKIKNATDNIMIKLACCILLHSFEEGQVYYNQLQTSDRKMFNQFPINNLWRANKNTQ